LLAVYFRPRGDAAARRERRIEDEGLLPTGITSDDYFRPLFWTRPEQRLAGHLRAEIRPRLADIRSQIRQLEGSDADD